MSFHSDDWKALWDKIVAQVQAHPLPFALIAILIVGILVGRCSAA